MNYSTIMGKRFLRAFGAILCLVMLVWVLPIASANAEDDAPDEVLTMDDIYVCLKGDDGLGELVPMHTVTSVGRENVKVRGVKSKNKLLEYTIPDELLLADGDFAALMMEADKYIGYPYVYGASNPREGFDCSGFSAGYSFIPAYTTQADAVQQGCIRSAPRLIRRMSVLAIWFSSRAQWDRM